MSAVQAFEQKLVSLIESGDLKVERIQSPHSLNYVSLIVGAIADSNKAGSIDPQYVSELRNGETEIDALMRRLLLSNLSLKVTLDPMYEVKPAVRDLLLEAEAISKTLDRDNSKLLAERMGDTQTVDVFFVKNEQLFQTNSDLQFRLTTFGKPEHAQQAIELGAYVKAATVVVPKGSDALEMAYELTQNLDNHWTSNPSVQSHNSQMRSSNVGDVMVIAGKAHLVAGMGFKALESFGPAQEAISEVKPKRDVDDSPSYP